MALKASGLKEKLNPKCILGYTDTETAMLDFDNTHFKDVRCWALRTMKWFKLEGFMILRSSKNNYHVVFDRPVSWSENMRIVAWVSLLSHNPMIEKWFIMQCIKEGSTLRVSPKKDKPCPRVVFRYGKQDNQIQGFLSFRKLIKKIVKRAYARGDRNGFVT
jgi:hypothetical protein